jgi:hypothetical protein
MKLMHASRLLELLMSQTLLGLADFEPCLKWWVLGEEGAKCFMFQRELTDTLSATNQITH